MILFPVFLALNTVYRLPAKKTIIRSMVDGLLLTALGLKFDHNIRRKRNILLSG
jgi:hypothetical protein